MVSEDFIHKSKAKYNKRYKGEDQRVSDPTKKETSKNTKPTNHKMLIFTPYSILDRLLKFWLHRNPLKEGIINEYQ